MKLSHAALACAFIVPALAGCSMASLQATGLEYAPGEGAEVKVGSNILVRNALVVADKEGKSGAFTTTLVNTGDKAQEVAIATAGGQQGAAAIERVTVPGSGLLRIDATTTPAITVQKLPVPVGQTMPLQFAVGQDVVGLAVPVMAAEHHLAGYAPKAAATSTPTLSTSPTSGSTSGAPTAATTTAKP